MALPKKKPAVDIAMVFGGGPKKQSASSEDLSDARSLLQDASPDVFTDEVLDALHEYIKDCAAEGSGGSDEEEAPPGEEY